MNARKVGGLVERIVPQGKREPGLLLHFVVKRVQFVPQLAGYAEKAFGLGLERVAINHDLANCDAACGGGGGCGI